MTHAVFHWQVAVSVAREPGISSWLKAVHWNLFGKSEGQDELILT